MATRKIVPRADNEGGIGTALKQWASGWIKLLTVTTINALTLAAASVGFTIAGGTTSKTLTVDETVAMSAKLTMALGAANLKAFMNAAGAAPEWATGIKLGSFTRDTSLASGTQAITGVGFKPSHVLFLPSIDGTPELSIGFDDGTNHLEVHNYHTITPNTWGYWAARCIQLVQGLGVTYDALISSMDADGFTISWVKTGAKTGTAIIFYIAFR